jgi:hypothetical protein
MVQAERIKKPYTPKGSGSLLALGRSQWLKDELAGPHLTVLGRLLLGV